jgi:hypothetical protein
MSSDLIIGIWAKNLRPFVVFFFTLLISMKRAIPLLLSIILLACANCTGYPKHSERLSLTEIEWHALQGCKEGPGDESDWIAILSTLHLYQAASIRQIIKLSDPALFTLILALPDGQLHSLVFSRFARMSKDFIRLNLKADRLAKSGNRFAAFLLYSAASCMTPPFLDRNLSLSLAHTYGSGYTNPLVAATATAILRRLTLHHTKCITGT